MMAINLAFVLFGALVVELFTIFLRYILKIQSREVMKKYNIPVRIHHMYAGVALMFLPVLWSPVIISNFITGQVTFLEVGFALFLSDIIHHFITLPLTGKDMDFP